MSSAVSPGSPSTPTSEGTSLVKAQGSVHGGSNFTAAMDSNPSLAKDLDQQCLTIGSKDLERKNQGDEQLITGMDLNTNSEKVIEKKEEESIGGLKGSWVRAVQGQKVLKKYDVEVTMKDGVGSVMVPEEITKDVPPLWEDFLIGKFLDTAPHIAKIHAIVNKIWNLNDKAQKIEVFEVDETSMKFKILNNADRNRILRRGMWNLAGIPVVVTKWSPVTEKEKPPVQSIPMWVHIKNVPIKMFSWQGLSFLTSPIGSPERLHPETAQCLKLDVAKIFVKVDLSKELPKKMNFTIQGEEVLVEYSYPRLPTKCQECGTWGHKTCAKGRESNESKKEVLEEGEIGVEKQEEKSGLKKAVEKGEVEGSSLLKASEVEKQIMEGDLSLSGKKKEEVKEDIMVEKVDKENEWLDVSPGKASCSPIRQTLEFGQVAILQNSRFSVLVEEQEEEMNEEEKELQIEEDILEETEVFQRQRLPRESKMNHRYLKDKISQKAQDVGPSYLNKKKPRRQ
ncbi:uncharacterized protein LOC130512878 [Raphanus sativus]|uniref:Uncharacterized protein LOC130512878 n=1 Tax=Raphanus sativus TaxID=3726 RepID=A0A9W3DUB5_RAPSA|nr:uncharacterized protein LOC130512878 [Raphanus sativus]